MIAIGEIFGDELVSNQKKDIVKRGEFNNQTHTVQPDEQGTENAIENTPGRLAYVHICSICKKSFNKKIELKEHLFVHNGDLKFKVKYLKTKLNSGIHKTMLILIDILIILK